MRIPDNDTGLSTFISKISKKQLTADDANDIKFYSLAMSSIAEKSVVTIAAISAGKKIVY